MIYLDHNATTVVRPEVARLIAQGLSEPLLGNPSSVHQAGRQARSRLDAARVKVSQVLGCSPKAVAFVGSGSEANALAVKGVFGARADSKRTRIVSSAIEHPSLNGALDQLAREGAEVVRVAPESNGAVSAARFIAELTPQTAIASLQWVNNETGVIQPIEAIAKACAERQIPFHCDAVQAGARLPIRVDAVPIDLLSLSGHKLGAPPGVGVLVGRRELPVQALTPGHQEDGRRGGTPAVLADQAFALALELAQAELLSEVPRLNALRDGFEQAVLAAIPKVFVNGGAGHRAAGTSNLRFEGADGEAILIALDLEGICASSGAACASGSLKPSHVLLAMGLDSTQAQESLRFSFGHGTTAAALEKTVEVLKSAVASAR